MRHPVDGDTRGEGGHGEEQDERGDDSRAGTGASGERTGQDWAESKQVRQTHSGNVFRGEFVRRVRDEEAGFSDSSITDDDAFDGLHGGREDGATTWSGRAAAAASADDRVMSAAIRWLGEAATDGARTAAVVVKVEENEWTSQVANSLS